MWRFGTRWFLLEGKRRACCDRDKHNPRIYEDQHVSPTLGSERNFIYRTNWPLAPTSNWKIRAWARIKNGVWFGRINFTLLDRQNLFCARTGRVGQAHTDLLARQRKQLWTPWTSSKSLSEHKQHRAGHANECERPMRGACDVWADIRAATRVRYGSASGRREAGKSGVWEYNDLTELLEAEPTAQPKISFLLFAFRRRGLGRSRKKNGKEIFGVARARYERGRGAESPRDPSVRFNPEPPRAPRVRNGFEQRLWFHHKIELRAQRAHWRGEAAQNRQAKYPVALRRIGTGRARRSARICLLFRI